MNGSKLNRRQVLASVLAAGGTMMLPNGACGEGTALHGGFEVLREVGSDAQRTVDVDLTINGEHCIIFQDSM